MINGIVNVYKEKGFTSHDVVAKMRGIVHQKKIGHTGTLDPDAEGVLPVCLGNATKLCDMLADRSKTYETVLQLGVVTDTQDMSGSICEENEVQCSEEQIRLAVQSFVGAYDQIPPMYSAKKVNGKKLYELAREGKTIERKPSRVFIDEIVVQQINLEQKQVAMRVSCSKGTYIRTLCHDIGSKLGCGGCMKSLLRTRVGMFDIKDSLRLSEIEQLCQKEMFQEYVRKPDAVFGEFCAITVVEKADRLVYNGNAINRESIREMTAGKTEQYRVYDSAHRFVGIYVWNEEKKLFKPFKMFL